MEEKRSKELVNRMQRAIIKQYPHCKNEILLLKGLVDLSHRVEDKDLATITKACILVKSYMKAKDFVIQHEV